MISDAPEYAACGTSVPLLSACEIETPSSFIGLFLSWPPFLISTTSWELQFGHIPI